MAIELDCPKCGLTVKIAEALLGKKLRCKKCQGTFTAEDPNSPFEEVQDFEVVEDVRESRPIRGPKPRRQVEHEDIEVRPRGGPRLRRSDLRTIALYQRALLFCILGHIGLFVFLALAADGPKILVVLVLASVEIACAVFMFLLAAQLYGVPVGIVLTVLVLIPLLGLIVMAVTNSKATATLNKHGYEVGFLGASLSQFV